MQLIVQPAAALSNDLRGYAADDGHGRNILGNNAIGSNDCSLSDSHTRQDRDSGGDPGIILYSDVSTYRGVAIAVDVVFKGPDVGFLRDVHVVSYHQASTSAVQKNSPVDDHAVADENVAATAKFNAHQEADTLPEFSDATAEKKQPNVATRNVHQEAIEDVRKETRGAGTQWLQEMRV